VIGPSGTSRDFRDASDSASAPPIITGSPTGVSSSIDGIGSPGMITRAALPVVTSGRSEESRLM
jgi:hypothetical protein